MCVCVCVFCYPVRPYILVVVGNLPCFDKLLMFVLNGEGGFISPNPIYHLCKIQNDCRPETCSIGSIQGSLLNYSQDQPRINHPYIGY